FFFQAEDGIRDFHVTGVQTCALPIYRGAHFRSTVYGQGATMALPIWALFMKKCYADENLRVSAEEFERPSNISVLVDCWKRSETDTVFGAGDALNGGNDSLPPPRQSLINEFDF